MIGGGGEESREARRPIRSPGRRRGGPGSCSRSGSTIRPPLTRVGWRCSPGEAAESDDARNHVVGPMVDHDIADRAVQFAARPPHVDPGTSFDPFGPIGPAMVSPASVDRDSLRVVTEVDGGIRRDASTCRLIFGVPTLVPCPSSATALAPGDLICAGTGTLTNRCVRLSDHRVC
ncbi:MAG: fumarylacetoacetate hydrolase family protein [Ilumatobacteraceae bacterium]